MPTAARDQLAALILDAGAGAPTLCEGWAVKDLAVHLVVRDGRPDVALGHLPSRLAPGPLRGVVERAQRHEAALRALPLDELTARLQAGPPRWSPLRLPALESAVNTVEFYVHGEDVRRAQPGWAHQPIEATLRTALWNSLRQQAKLHLAYRRSPVGVVLAVPEGPRVVARAAGPGAESVVVRGQPEELVLHAFGRTSVADVEVTGSDAAVAAFSA